MTMLSKPETCKGCPMYQDGFGWVPDEQKDGAVITVLCQNPGQHEERGMRVTGYEYAGRRRVPIEEPYHPAPLIGATGYDWERKYLPHSGLDRTQVDICNVLKCR